VLTLALHRAAAVAAVKQAAAGRADLLAECAGLALGYGERQPEAAHYQRMAGWVPGHRVGLSASVITRLTETWKAEAAAFAARDLSGVDYVYLWADGIHVNVRLAEHKLCLLVMIGIDRVMPTSA
jgi:mutator family transposase